MALLELKNVGAHLGEPPRIVLEGIDLSIRPGSISLLLGPNGSGKSVLLRTVLGLVRGYSGEITLDGHNLAGEFHTLHRRAGVVFQNPDHQLFGATVREDILIGTPERSEPDVKLLDALGIEDLLDRAPAELSGGQRRRVAIAGALAPQPDLLFLDEPFIELDYPSIQRLLMRLAEMRAQGCAVLLASHESQDIWPLVDQLLILQGGNTLYLGEPSRGGAFIGPENGLRPLTPVCAPV